MEFIKMNDLPISDKNSIRIPKFLLSNGCVSADSKLLYAMIADHQSMTIQELISDCGYSKKKVNRCIKELIHAGLIENTTLDKMIWRTT